MHAPLFKKVQQQKRQLSLKKAGENQKIHYKLLRWIRGLIYTRTSPRCVGRNSSIHLVRVNTQAGKTNREKERRITVYNPYSPYHPPTTAPTQYKDDTHTLIKKKKPNINIPSKKGKEKNTYPPYPPSSPSSSSTPSPLSQSSSTSYQHPHSSVPFVVVLGAILPDPVTPPMNLRLRLRLRLLHLTMTTTTTTMLMMMKTSPSYSTRTNWQQAP